MDLKEAEAIAKAHHAAYQDVIRKGSPEDLVARYTEDAMLAPPGVGGKKFKGHEELLEHARNVIDKFRDLDITCIDAVEPLTQDKIYVLDSWTAGELKGSGATLMVKGSDGKWRLKYHAYLV